MALNPRDTYHCVVCDATASIASDADQLIHEWRVVNEDMSWVCSNECAEVHRATLLLKSMGETNSLEDILNEAIRQCRRVGGTPQQILVNPDTHKALIKRLVGTAKRQTTDPHVGIHCIECGGLPVLQDPMVKPGHALLFPDHIGGGARNIPLVAAAPGKVKK